MVNVFVVLPKLEEAKTIKNILVRNGFSVTGISTTGSQAISQTDGLHDGVVICGYKLEDMLYNELKEYLPDGFELLLLASQRILTEEVYGEGMICLSMPLRLNDFVSTVGMLTDDVARRRKKKNEAPVHRSAQEDATVKLAKDILMERNHMSEEEAHKYLQKSSMNSGTSLVETAQMVLAMLS
ncbi:MAG: ANTAR domain-containing protein [Lachnospiraceae bacterium]|nr:ANTAR domain-containing protein [Lachnospiraceae bacterium]